MPPRILTVAELENRGEASLQTGPFGTQLKASEYVEEGIPVINVRNIGFGDVRKNELEYLNEAKAEKLFQHHLRKGDIVFGRKGAVERHALIDETTDGWIQGSDCLRLRIKSPDVCERYLSYYLKTQAHQDWMQALCSFGATMSSLNQGIVRRISFPAPAIGVQKKIAAILSAYDDLIENNRRRIALLEQMAEELYREWFVRLRFPGHEQAKFEKGVPAGWRVEKVSALVDRKRFGRIYRENELSSEGAVVVIDQSRNEWLGFHNGKAEHNASLEHPLILFGDHSCKMQIMIKPFSLAENVVPFCGKADIPTVFLYYLVHSLIETTEYKRHWTELMSKEVFVPSHSIQLQFDRVARDVIVMVRQLRAANSKLAKARDLLLPRLISGKLSVESLDIRFPPGMEESAHEI